MNKIKELRLSHGLTQKELAAELGVKQNTLSTWETGRYEPDSDMLRRIADRFDTSTDYILGSLKKTPTTETGGGQAQKLAQELSKIGIDVDSLTEAEVRRIVKIVKAAFED